MKIELKKIEYSERMSEETACFVADLYIDGKKAAQVQNDGHGGADRIDPYTKEDHQLVAQAEAFCKTLPPSEWKVNGEQYALDMTLELYIGELLEQYLEEKELKRFQKLIDKAADAGIVFGKMNDFFRVMEYKLPLAKVLEHPAAAAAMATVIRERVLPMMDDGEMILNRNIPEEILSAAGLKPEHYLPPEVATVKEKHGRAKGKGLSK